MSPILSIFYFIILIFSIIAHEVMHGLVAEREGDPTARLLGRITLNPLKHIDWFGSVILPLVLVLSSAGFVVGWAKPVPYNPENVRNGRKSVAKIAAAGPIINLAIAIVFALITRGMLLLGIAATSVYTIVSIIILTNLVLAVFNLLPFAPLDGFNILSSLLSYKYDKAVQTLSRVSLPILIIFLVFGWKFVMPVIFLVFTLLTGITL